MFLFFTSKFNLERETHDLDRSKGLFDVFEVAYKLCASCFQSFSTSNFRQWTLRTRIRNTWTIDKDIAALAALATLFKKQKTVKMKSLYSLLRRRKSTVSFDSDIKGQEIIRIFTWVFCTSHNELLRRHLIVCVFKSDIGWDFTAYLTVEM